MKILESINLQKHRIDLIKREECKSYPNHPYLVALIRLTPKAKYTREKSIWRYVYKTMEEASDKAVSTALNISANEKTAAEEKEKRKRENAEVSASDFYKIGDIIVNSWGYEQTNIEFYQVVEVSPKTILVKEVYQSTERGSEYSHGMACNVVPDINSFMENGDEYRLRVYSGGSLSNPQSFYYMKKWDGKPKYKSWYA